MNNTSSLQNLLKPWRIVAFMVALGLVFLIFSVRLLSLQVLQADSWVAKAEDNSTKEFNLPSLRGIILDRNDVVLARNVPSYNVVITAANLPDDEGALQEIFREMSALIGIPVHKGELSPENPYVPCISDHGIAQVAEYGESATPFEPVKVKCDIDEQLAMVVQEKSVDWPGVGIEVQPLREYPTSSLTASIVGFLGPIPASQEEFYVEKGSGSQSAINYRFTPSASDRNDP
jgi:penicillin-binding protein 2